MYECVICQSLNHATHYRCQYCGAIPLRYSILGVPAFVIDDDVQSRFIPFVVAEGAIRACQHHAQQINLRTVPLDYYGE